MAEVKPTLAQQKALAIARTKLKLKEEAPPWSEVLKQAPIKMIAGSLDQLGNTPENALNLIKMAYGAGAITMGHSELAPDVQMPENELTDLAVKHGLIDQNPNMTTGQKVVDAGIQGAVGGMIGPAGGLVQRAANMAVDGLGSAAGRGVAEGTGSETMGALTSMALPGGAAMTPSLNSAKTAAKLANATRDQTLDEARNLGLVVVPEGRAAEFASRPKMLETVVEVNQTRTNELARESLGLQKAGPMDDKILSAYRNDQYQRGYMPLKALGRMVTDMDYIDELVAVERKYTGAKNTFPADLSPKLKNLIDKYLVTSMDTGDVVDKVKFLREQAAHNINSEKAVSVELGWAQKAIANAMENLIERHATANGIPPEIIGNYRNARQKIAVSHVVGDSMIKGSGDINGDKLARAYQRGEFMNGNLETIAKFYNINKPNIKTSNASDPYSYWLGASAASLGAHSMGIDSNAAIAALAFSGAAAGKASKELLSKPMRKYMMSKTGQKNAKDTYSNLGIDPYNSILSSELGFFNSMGPEEKE